MIQDHRLDAPERVSGEMSPDRPDRSGLNFFYPEVKQDTRPLIKSDAERHRLHDQQLSDHQSQLHRYVAALSLQTVGPAIIALCIVTFAMTGITQSNAALVIPLLIAAGLLWFGLTRWLLGSVFDRVQTYGSRGGVFIFFSYVILGTASPVLWWLTTYVADTWPKVAMAASGAFVVSIIASKILVIVATRRPSAARQTG